MRISHWLLAPLLAMFFLFLVACGDDVVDGEGTNQSGDCGVGYEYSPVSERCESTGDGSGDGGGSGDGTSEGDAGTGDGTGPEDDGGTGDSSTEPDPDQVCGEGRIEGQACTPDGSILSQAQITLTGVDCEGVEVELQTTADGEGNYVFEDVPAGDHTLEVSAGSFSGTDIVRVFPDETTDLSADGKKVCVGGDINIAIIDGVYDDVAMLLDSMEIEYDFHGTDGGGVPVPLMGVPDSEGLEEAQLFLSHLPSLMEYDILFLECGWLFDNTMDSAVFNQVIGNLQQFVAAGKSIYTSDYAHPFVEEAFPDAVQFYNEASGHGGPRAGDGSQTITADVISTEMLTLLGASTAELFLNLGSWTVAEGGGPNTQIHFQGEAQLAGGGSVSDAPLMLSYKDPTSNGTVIFTSFHNSAQEDLGGDMEEVLRFMIFQL